MRIGVISDSHNNFANLSKSVNYLVERGVNVIIHLGDDYDDFDKIDIAHVLDNNIQIIRVPGVFSQFYKDIKIKNRIVQTYEDKKFLLTHTIKSHENDLPDDIKPENLIEDNKINLVLYGHTHIPEIRIENGIIYLNPGHLKNEDSKEYEPTYGMIDFGRKFIYIYYLKSNEVFVRLKFE
jgi:putative phosphoesterase